MFWIFTDSFRDRFPSTLDSAVGRYEAGRSVSKFGIKVESMWTIFHKRGGGVGKNFERRYGVEQYNRRYEKELR